MDFTSIQQHFFSSPESVTQGRHVVRRDIRRCMKSRGACMGHLATGPAMVVNRCPKPQSWTRRKEAPAVFLALLLTGVDKPLFLLLWPPLLLSACSSRAWRWWLPPPRARTGSGGWLQYESMLRRRPPFLTRIPHPSGPTSSVLPQAAAQGQGTAAAFPPAPTLRPGPGPGPLRGRCAPSPRRHRGAAEAEPRLAPGTLVPPPGMGTPRDSSCKKTLETLKSTQV